MLPDTSTDGNAATLLPGMAALAGAQLKEITPCRDDDDDEDDDEDYDEEDEEESSRGCWGGHHQALILLHAWPENVSCSSPYALQPQIRCSCGGLLGWPPSGWPPSAQ